MNSQLKNELLSLASKVGVAEDERERMAEHLARANQKIADLTAKSDLLCLTIERIISAIASADLLELIDQIDLVDPLISGGQHSKLHVSWLGAFRRKMDDCNSK